MGAGGRIPPGERLARRHSHLQRGLDTDVQEEVQQCALLWFENMYTYLYLFIFVLLQQTRQVTSYLLAGLPCTALPVRGAGQQDWAGTLWRPAPAPGPYPRWVCPQTSCSPSCVFGWPVARRRRGAPHAQRGAAGSWRGPGASGGCAGAWSEWLCTEGPG